MSETAASGPAANATATATARRCLMRRSVAQSDAPVQRRHTNAKVPETQEPRTMKLRNLGLAAGAVLLAAGGALQAHHASSAEFDANAPVPLRGPITRIE